MRISFAGLMYAAVLGVAILLTGCAASGAKKTTEAVMPEHVTAEQIRAMSPCRATVEERHPCYSIFKAADGHRFSIGSPAAKQEVVQFLGTLQEGKTYRFPVCFVEYQEKRR